MKPTARTIHSQPSWTLENDQVSLAVTQLGGHMAPVSFYRDTASPIEPYYISPWQDEKLDIDVPVLVPLRGDFFCAPFGADNNYRGEKHDDHGEPATAKWTGAQVSQADDMTTLSMNMKTRSRTGSITKKLSLIQGHNAIYCEHILSGYSGKMCLGHHATLAADDDKRQLTLSSSPFAHGATFPGLYADPRNREYQALAIDKPFRSLRRVPTRFKSPAALDLTKYPHLHGYEDQIALFKQPGDAPAWVTAVAAQARYLWFSLKDPAVLPATVFWMSNRGRHGAPWNGRNLCLGLEDVCGYFAAGLAPSATTNPVNRMGIPTTLGLTKRRNTHVRTIQGAVKLPPDFVKVRTVRFTDTGLTFRCVSGSAVTAPLRHDFIYNGL